MHVGDGRLRLESGAAPFAIDYTNSGASAPELLNVADMHTGRKKPGTTRRRAGAYPIGSHLYERKTGWQKR